MANQDIVSTRDQCVRELASQHGISFDQASRMMQREAFGSFMSRGHKSQTARTTPPMTAAPAAPPAPPSSKLQFRGKTYANMSNRERADLHAENIELFNSMRDAFHGVTTEQTPLSSAALTFKGKTYAQMNNRERADLHAADLELFSQMREQAINTKAI